MKVTITKILAFSAILVLSGCSKGAPDIENLDELKKMTEGGHGRFVFKVEGKEYIYSHYYRNFCANKTDDKNCILANDLFHAYKNRPSNSVFRNN